MFFCDKPGCEKDIDERPESHQRNVHQIRVALKVNNELVATVERIGQQFTCPNCKVLATKEPLTIGRVCNTLYLAPQHNTLMPTLNQHMNWRTPYGRPR